MAQKLITFAVPCYNSAAYMRHCIETLLSAGEQAEIILVDDGSTKDDTPAICDEYAAKYPTIVKAIHQENGGHGEGVNQGIRNATGLYYKVVDSDDWLDEAALRTVLAKLNTLTARGTAPDLMICNYVYEHVEDNTSHTVRYTNVFPQNRLFSWTHVGHFRPDQNLLMHSVMYRTQVLRDCGALKVLFPEIDALFGVPAPAKWHPEIDTGIHTLMTLSMAAMLSPEVDVRFSTLCHDLGKGLTPKELWPRHHGHGPAGVKLVEGLCQRLRVPNDIRDLAKLVAEFHDLIHTFPILKPATIVKLFDNIDAWRKPQRVEQIALTSEADVRGRTGFEACDYPQGRLLRKAWEVAKAVPTKDVVEAGFKGPEIREELTKRRIQAVSDWKEKHCPQPKD